jgi:hypothetical protein
MATHMGRLHHQGMLMRRHLLLGNHYRHHLLPGISLTMGDGQVVGLGLVE